MENDIATKGALISEQEQSDSTTNEQKHVCNICGKHFEWKSGLSRHKKVFHLESKVKNFVCNICGQSFYKQVGLSLHIKLHKKTAEFTKPRQKISKIYANIVSETVYSSDSDCEYEILQTVVKVKTDSGQQCKHCSKKFLKSESLQMHLKKHILPEQLEEKSDDNTDIVENITENASEYFCNKCNKTFKRSSNLANHLKIHLKHSILARKHPNNVVTKRKYVCTTCGNAYSKQMHLDNHLVVHKNDTAMEEQDKNKSYVCTICGKSYTTSSHLSVHLRVHMEYKPHLCSVCGNLIVLHVGCFC